MPTRKLRPLSKSFNYKCALILSFIIMTAPKYPRVMVSAKRHTALAREAKKLGLSLTQHAENIFKAAAPKK